MRIGIPAAMVAALTLAGAIMPASAASVDDKTAQKQAEIPNCSHKLGALTVHEPQNNWWTALGLESPEALLKVFVMKSGCFTLLDRGAGFQMAQQERALGQRRWHSGRLHRWWSRRIGFSYQYFFQDR